MTLSEVLVIAIALSMDAFGVALSLGFNSKFNLKNKFLYSGSFGFFQFAFAFGGAIIGMAFSNLIVSIPTVIGGISLLIVGILMIKEGLKGEEEKEVNSTGLIVAAVLGVSVSLDALIVGFSVMAALRNTFSIFYDSILIGLVTLVFTFIAFELSTHLKKIKIIEKYSVFLGGTILILLGLKMLLM